MLWKKKIANIHMPRSVQSPSYVFFFFLRTFSCILFNVLQFASCKARAFVSQEKSVPVFRCQRPRCVSVPSSLSLALSLIPLCARRSRVLPWLSSLKLWSCSCAVPGAAPPLAAAMPAFQRRRSGSLVRAAAQVRCWVRPVPVRQQKTKKRKEKERKNVRTHKKTNNEKNI